MYREQAMGEMGFDQSSSTQTHLFSRRVTLSAGKVQHVAGEHNAGSMKRGLKVAVLLDGHQSYSLDDRPALTLTGPTLFVATCRNDHFQTRTCLKGGTLQSVIVQFAEGFAETELGANLAGLMGQKGAGEPGLWVRPADAHLQALAIQIIDTRITGSMRVVYLGGKALELAAVAVDQITNERPARRTRLTSQVIEQIHAARDLLLASPQHPPSLNELARKTGLNPTKLTLGFRRIFGTSVFDYLKEHRLQEAYHLIHSGEKSVAEAAYLVGYNPAHFSGLFRKRFGILPSSLRWSSFVTPSHEPGESS
jgi:AraC family transcriptional activator of pyochelin receptor